MNKKLTIGEMARFLNISTHQIRYYEEKGVITPEKNAENGYRQYGLKEVYTLSHILLLRNFNISVPDIKRSFEDESGSSFFNLLMTSSDGLQRQIDELILLKQKTELIRTLAIRPDFSATKQPSVVFRRVTSLSISFNPVLVKRNRLLNLS
ncbi:MAG TPA: MerR family transcriptional regulator [Thermotogota bacterium]|nr:MerR family transcriptional regulator [Thermotogota bacterium]